MSAEHQVPSASVTAGKEAKDVALVPAGNEAPAQEPVPLTRQTNATTKRITIRLDQLVMDPERYCHRDPEALREENLKHLQDSISAEGLQSLIEVLRDQLGRFVIVKGHRRAESLLALARKNTAGFTTDMELEVIQLENFTPQDALVRSIADNEVRLNFDRLGRIRAAKKLYDAGVEEARAAAALGSSIKTYQRDLLIARHGWMFQHIIDGSIEATAAYELLEAAEKTQRIPEVKEDLDAWVAGTKRVLREKERLQKLQGGKALSATERQVKRQMPKHLVDHWLELIPQGQRFDEDSEWDFAAHLDRQKRQLHLGALNLDLDKDPVDQIAKVASKLSLLSKQLAPFLQQRLAVQPPDATEGQLYDLSYLEQLGAKELAEHLQGRQQIVKDIVEGEGIATVVNAPQAEPVFRAREVLQGEFKAPEEPSSAEEEEPIAVETPVK